VEDARRGGDALAAVLYTGGTTGFPKGAMLSHTNLLTSTLGTLAKLPAMQPGGRVLLALPMFHAAGLAVWMLQQTVGGTSVILPKFEPEAVLETIERHRVTFTALVPTMLQQVVDHPARADRDLSSLETLLYSASPMNAALLGRALRAFPRTEFVQSYGMTELGPIATLLTPEEHRAGAHRRSVGRAAPHAEVRVVDEDDREVPRGTAGEIVCRGANVMLGYWDRPQESAEALRGGWMHTGDAGYLDDGADEIVAHAKALIAGYKVPRSVEFVDALPLSPAGKVLKRELRLPYWEGMDRLVH
jgi:acyl-CoA synthetase (AMP-forming)/AMP-acid ligase II